MSSPAYVAVTLVVMLAWQIHAVTVLIRGMPSIIASWADFGGEVSPPLQLLAAHYPVIAVLPVISAALVAYVSWRKAASHTPAAAVFVFLVVSVALLDAVATHALFAPILSLRAAIE